ncbi:glycosyl hydrolase 53 family protein [Microvirga sp. STS02]|uniref:glycoside hydrolase family 53 protein n=1 Tax=Hymenobacter negativus TaxID=2795026 RepID=UPI0018DE2A33|nr:MULTISPECIES: glycosyl hydrolase 53 family protein [Bacteria]MBH8568728.1 glycosyl hydrolase 53 family protein [Hymenobacter negativus]MBR7208462.1 glycosyl hydrolase 53 family protein [Microvirga sp. STS02]
MNHFSRTALLLGAAWCATAFSAPEAAAQAFAKGADVGWLQQMEATGYVFRNEQGVPQDCFTILKAQGINSIRLRVFVNPSDDKASGHCSPAEVVTMAQRATDLGFRVMIDFHYSDTWADPGKQAKPAAWASHPFPQLLTDVYDHTFSTMKALRASGVTPEWVQVGNEIPGGMLWPEGSTKNFPQLAQLITKGYEAVKAASPGSKVVVHLDRGNDNAMYRDFFDKLTANGGKFDVIGMSYYPYWLKQDYTASIANLRANLLDMVARYPGKEVVVAEVGNDYTAVQNTYDMLIATQQAVRAVPQYKGLGVFYWEPEGAKSWSGYQLCAWGDDGKPSPALNAFRTAPAKPAKGAK